MKTFLYWLPMVAIAFANATLRELVLVRHLDHVQAYQVSTLTLATFCGIYAWLCFSRFQVSNARKAFKLGFTWMVLTILFEFGLGIATRKSLSVMLENYNLAAGSSWPLLLLWLLLLPLLIYGLKQRR